MENLENENIEYLNSYLYSALKISKRALSELRSRNAIADDMAITMSLTNLLHVITVKSN